jgi:hypothetical protein
MRRPGRNRPSVSRNPAELDERDDDDEDGRGGSGEDAVISIVAISIVATSSVFDMGRGVATLALGVGVPQAEQKRTFAASSVPHEEQKDMKISRYSVQRGREV